MPVAGVAIIAAASIGWRVHINSVASEKLAEAARVTRAGAEQGLAEAQVALGSLYCHGQGVPLDCREALRWFQKSSDQGDPSGRYHVGVMYYYGPAVPQDYGEAIRLFREAADHGYSTAQDQLGTMFANGIGLPQDYAAAFAWYRKSAELGYARGQEHFGTMYYRGHGVKQDYVEAASWYRKAADQGDPAAEYDLGAMYHYGQGVPQSLTEARGWLRTAAVQDNDDALSAITFGLATPEKIVLRMEFALGLVLVLSFIGHRTFRKKVTTATGVFILFSAGYDWYGCAHRSTLLPIYGLDAFTALFWLLALGVLASIVYIVRLGKKSPAEGRPDDSLARPGQSRLAA